MPSLNKIGPVVLGKNSFISFIYSNYFIIVFREKKGGSFHLTTQGYVVLSSVEITSVLLEKKTKI